MGHRLRGERIKEFSFNMSITKLLLYPKMSKPLEIR